MEVRREELVCGGKEGEELVCGGKEREELVCGGKEGGVLVEIFSECLVYF